MPAAGTGEIIGSARCRTAPRSTSRSRRSEDRGVARRLAEPNLIARSGERASFLAGGEVPIPVSEDNGQITVTTRSSASASISRRPCLQDGLISLEIAPEVSSVDTSASYQVGNGITVPGFIVRRAQTSIDLKNGQSFMIAGLLQTQNDMITPAHSGPGQDAGARSRCSARRPISGARPIW